MERVSGWYKRNAQKWALLLALLMAVAFNIDTLSVGSRLWHDSSLRQVVGALAQSQVQNNQGSSLDSLTKDLTNPAFTALPLGWQQPPWDPTRWTNSHVVENVARKLVGFALTTLALWLGAPFWFDVLKGLGSLRSSGDPPKKADQATPA
jgi:hypothetical protein